MKKIIRLLVKLAAIREVGEGSERRTGVYTPVHEDSSTEPTNQFSIAVEFCQKSIFAAVLALSVASCASERFSPNMDTANLDNLKALDVSNTPLPPGHEVAQIRLAAIKETALTLGAQGGLAYQSERINRTLLTQADHLAEVFNFRGLLLNHNVQPPVLEEGQQLMHLAGSDSIRVSDKTYRIVKQARFVTAPLDWQDYLITHFPAPEVPDKTLLPHNKGEQKVWAIYIQKGWEEGIQQANDIYAANVARLQRDYNGMILYRQLLAEHMVSAPYVAQSNLGVTTNSQDTQLYINDQVLRITTLPRLNPNAHDWQPVVTQHE